MIADYIGRKCAMMLAILKEPVEIAHSLGLVIDGAIVAALVTGEPSVADAAGRTCAAILAEAKR